jgi:hypothetical protein
MTWWNDYVGIPYEFKGRDRSGIDCWGLVRLVHKEHFGNDLPSLDDRYVDNEARHLEELMATQREGWFVTDKPKTGDVVLLRVAGTESHIGIFIDDGKFIHAKRGANVVIEELKSSKWQKRIVGFYRYEPNSVPVSALIHPLKTQRIDATIKAGSSLQEIFDDFQKILRPELRTDAIIMVDGIVISKEEWSTYKTKENQRIEYRPILGDDNTFKAIATIAIIYAAITYGPAVGTALGFTGTTASVVGSAVINISGTLLVNSIFPVRPPELNNGLPSTTNSQLLMQGGRNEGKPYAPIPVVLGKIRYSPPLGAITYAEHNSTTSYLRMMLAWGYGQLAISDIRIGDVKIDSYEDVEYETINDYSGDSADEIKHFNSLYGKDVSYDEVGVELISDGTNDGSPYTEKVISDQCDRIDVTLHFPQGLRRLVLEGGNAGKIDPAAFRGQIQYRELDPDTLAPLTNWGNIDSVSKETVFNFEPAWFNIDTDEELEKVYRWTRITIDERGKVKRYDGAYTNSQYANPSGSLLTRLQNDTFGFNTSFVRLVDIPEGEEEIWRVCVYGNDIVETTDVRDVTITGAALSSSGLKVTIASATIARAETENIRIGASGQLFYRRKDAFTYKHSFAVAKGKYEVRVRRTNTSEEDYTYGSGNKGRNLHQCIFASVTGYENTRPVVAPRGSKLCMTAIRIKATDQINGAIDSIAGTVQSICPDYDVTSDTWITRPTRNPASLFRYVLQHPANAQKVADSKINLDELATWHTFCRTNKFMFDMVIQDQRSLLDVLRDICAAGRSSPTLKDGKWTVITDKPRSSIVQFFTPHNSWGFSSSRLLPKLPHGFRVTFNNAEKSYQADEMIVYNDGYSSSNATIFETMSFPGVTTKDQIFKHARFHLAQMKLRPETYTLNADIEHLVCNRGDRVKVTHDVPMWGLATGRIKTRTSSTELVLDESVPMDAGVQYTIRIRLEDGSSITRTVQSVGTDGLYNTITLTSSVTATQAKTNNLFMFGTLSEESVDLIVHSIEPAENMTAKIELVDYSPAIYDSDDEVIPAFDSQITKPPYLQQRKITQTPTIGTITSDESVLVRVSDSTYQVRMKVNFTNPRNLDSLITKVRAQIDFANDKIEDWEQTIIVDAKARSVIFGDVIEGDSYKVRMRYESDDGKFGGWVVSSSHTIVGKTNPPASVTSLTASIFETRLKLNWADNLEPDVVAYEVRSSNSGWGNSSRVFYGKTSECVVDAPAAGSSVTYYVKAVDANQNYSTAATSVTYSASAIANPSSVSHIFADTALTNATITLDWNDVSPPFGLDHYKIQYDGVTKTVNGSTITLAADWIGNRSFVIKTVDLNGNQSSGYTYNVTKLAPNAPSNFRAQVIDNNVMLYWTLPTKTTLPIDHCQLRKGSTWESSTLIGDKKGAFTTVNERQGGSYTYWIVAVDTDANESDPVSVSALVNEPPDFIFYGEFNSNFDDTFSNSFKENDYVVAPVNTTETFQEHFTNNSWSTPKDQIDAGYPIFIQPANGSGYYEETFDFGTILSSSRISSSYSGEIIDGTPTVETTISISEDDVTYTDFAGYSEIYGTNFRYVKIRLTISEGDDDTGIYKLTGLNVRLDAKLKNDQGRVSAVSTDANGTIVNFVKEFIDIQSIVLTPSGTSSTVAVYDFVDANLAATYSVASNVCTVTYTSHGFITGQKVRLQFSSGNGIDGVYTITGYTANTFTVSMTIGNTSGNALVYAESFRVYLFNSSGTRVSGSASWSARGY